MSYLPVDLRDRLLEADNQHCAFCVISFGRCGKLKKLDFAHLVKLDEIEANHGNLSISLYVHVAGGYNNNAEAGKSLPAVIAEWQESSGMLRESTGLFTALQTVGITTREEHG